MRTRRTSSIAFTLIGAATLPALGYVPIDDLRTGHYLNQYQGGLYPGGSNTMPAAHLADGLSHSANVLPVNTAGQPDAAGKFVMISVGMSNTSQEWCGNDNSLIYQNYSLMGQAAVHPAVDHANMVLFNGARGGQDASTWDSPTDANYARVATDLNSNGLSELQVRAAWLKVANAQPTSSLPNANADANQLVQQMGNILRSMKTHYPNLEMVFISSRIYAGYATSQLNPEPYAYESGFAVKHVIEAQINQLDNASAIDPLAGDLGSSVAPWVGWGPYLWADGANPRGTDGLTWQPTDYNTDGTHPNTAGRTKVATMLMRNFINSPLTRDWFLRYRQGDADRNGTINFDDYVRIDHGFNVGAGGWGNGDFNYDGVVNFDDYVLIDINFNKQNGTLARAIAWVSGDDRSASDDSQPGVQTVIDHVDRFGEAYAQAFLSAVPEPMALSGVIASATTLALKRRRSHHP